jgi:hypothetical protein
LRRKSGSSLHDLREFGGQYLGLELAEEGEQSIPIDVVVDALQHHVHFADSTRSIEQPILREKGKRVSTNDSVI